MDGNIIFLSKFWCSQLSKLKVSFSFRWELGIGIRDGIIYGVKFKFRCKNLNY